MSQFLAKNRISGCPQKGELHRYLHGWMDEVEYERTDSHVATCQKCESTIAEFDESSDTLTDALRGISEPAGTDEVDPVVANALNQARGLMDVSPTGEKPIVESIGAYDLLEQLGHGGMGAVYLARHRELQKEVAIKLLPTTAHQSPEVRARFSREALAVGSLNDPRIVAATDAGEVDGTRYLVMERVSGMDLSRLTRHIGRLRTADACELVRQVAMGLSTAHLSLIHI